jgi:hypothetical protein
MNKISVVAFRSLGRGRAVCGYGFLCFFLAGLFYCAHTIAPSEQRFIITAVVNSDTVVAVRDSLTVRVSIASAKSPTIKYVYFVDSSRFADTTYNDLIVKKFSLADTGRRLVVIRAWDGGGNESVPDTLPILVRYQLPVVLLTGDTTVFCGAPYALHIVSTAVEAPVVRTEWYVDDPKKTMLATDSVVPIAWTVADTGRHRIVIRAIDSDGIVSLPDTLHVTVTCTRPAVTLSVPATAAIDDSVSFIAHATVAAGMVKWYRWSIDGGGWFATDTSLLRWTFGNSSTGTAVAGSHTVCVVAVDNDGTVSDTARGSIVIRLFRPVVKLTPRDTMTVYADAPLKIMATAFDTNGIVASWRWMIDGRLQPQLLKCDSLMTTWGVLGAGVHLVSLTVLDNDSLASLPDTLQVTVLPGTPLVKAMRAMTVSSADTAKITCMASDPNGVIVKYLWSFSGNEGNRWVDSTSAPYYPLTYFGSGTVKVLVGARDNDGLIATDTVTITFNRPPDPITVLHPGSNDTIAFTQSAARCTVSFAYNAPDPDSDAVTYTLSWGSSSPDSVIYQGPGRAASIVVSRPGLYFWSIIARDSWGHSRTTSGKTVVLREYRICFIGHSIVVGMCGDGIMGGFRGGVLDSLRKTLGTYERLKVVGPYTTSYMSRSATDDSCMAVSGTTAREIYLMFAFDQVNLNADIWVFMIGVNGSYSYIEWGYATNIIDCIISRNLQSRVYIVNGCPLPGSSLVEYYLPYFNQALVDTAESRNARGAHVSVVDYNTAMTMPDGQLDTTLFSPPDYIHPKQLGYNKLRDWIYSAMTKSNPLALPNNP